MTVRILLAILFAVGLWGVVARRHLVKKVFGLTIMNSAIVILFVEAGSRIGTQAPIMEEGVSNVVDPVPQALMLTAVVVGVCVTALALALAYRIHRATGSLDIEAIRKGLDGGHR